MVSLTAYRASLPVHLVPPVQCSKPALPDSLRHLQATYPPNLFLAPPAPSLYSACLPVCLPCSDSRPRTVHFHMQNCSSINKGLPFPLSTPPWPLWDLQLEAREKTRIENPDFRLISQLALYLLLMSLLSPNLSPVFGLAHGHSRPLSLGLQHVGWH